jgi:hypothetical protein
VQTFYYKHNQQTTTKINNKTLFDFYLKQKIKPRLKASKFATPLID